MTVISTEESGDLDIITNKSMKIFTMSKAFIGQLIFIIPNSSN